MAGSDVRLESEVAGDAALAGESVSVTAPVRGDALIFGRELDLDGPFGADVYAAGADVRLAGDVAGSARLAGADVSVGPNSEIAGALSIAAARAQIAGNVAEYAQVAAGSTSIRGRVAGDLDVSGAELTLEPGAVVDGKLTFRGPAPATIASGATVRGEVLHLPTEDAEPNRFGVLWALLAGALWWLGAALVGALIWALWPGFVRDASSVLRTRTGTALLCGLGVAGGIPLAIVVLFVSLIGIPLGILLGYLYLALIPLGFLLAAAAITEALSSSAQREPRSLRRRLLWFFPVMLVLGLLLLVPVVGALAMVLLVLLGVGSLTLTAVERHRHGSVTRPSAEQATGVAFPPASGPGSRPAPSEA